MKDKDLIEILTFLLKTQRKQAHQIDSLLRGELPELPLSELIDEETARKVAELLLLVDQPPSE